MARAFARRSPNICGRSSRSPVHQSASPLPHASKRLPRNDARLQISPGCGRPAKTGVKSFKDALWEGPGEEQRLAAHFGYNMKSGFDLPPSIVAPRFRDQLDLIEGELRTAGPHNWVNRIISSTRVYLRPN